MSYSITYSHNRPRISMGGSPAVNAAMVDINGPTIAANLTYDWNRSPVSHRMTALEHRLEDLADLLEADEEVRSYISNRFGTQWQEVG